jgi:hypothetical protein
MCPRLNRDCRNGGAVRARNDVRGGTGRAAEQCRRRGHSGYAQPSRFDASHVALPVAAGDELPASKLHPGDEEIACKSSAFRAAHDAVSSAR